MPTKKKKIRFDIISIFPRMFESYFGDSIIARARQHKLVDIRLHDLRKWSTDKHHKVDDKPFGGGPGMVMMIEPFFRAIRTLKIKKRVAAELVTREALLVPRSFSGVGAEWVASAHPYSKTKKTRIVLMSAKGKRFTHKDAVRLAKYDRIVLLCGRYEGVDERVAKHIADEEISIGDFVLTGGELPAMVIVDAVARHIPGVLGKQESLAQESHTEEGLTEYPQYTRPADFSPAKDKHWRAPDVLLSGDHKKVEDWRRNKSKKT